MISNDIVLFILYCFIAFISYREMRENDRLRSKVVQLSKDNLDMAIKLEIYRNSNLYNV